MGKLTMKLYLHHLRERYSKANKEEKGLILNEFCENSGYHRKSAVRLLNYKPKPRKKINPGRKKIYDPETIIAPLKKLWLATDQMCGKRLKAAIPIWLPHYEKSFGTIDDTVKEHLLRVSSSTIDRLLKPHKTKNRRRLCGTKPGSLLKQQIPIKTDQWDTSIPGFVEADTVAHCGEHMCGDFIWSITLTDIASTWTENRAIWNKGSAGVIEQIESIESSLPFKLLGFDSDNGSEFLNQHLYRYFCERPEKVQFTRSRPYKKNDNAHVEQKNWTHVRQILGYYRLDNPIIVELMNDLYQNELSLLHNYFYPTIKLIEKQRIGSKIKKKYDQPKTPYERLLGAEHISEEQKLKLKNKFAELDPFELQKTIQTKLNKIFSYVKLNNRQKRKGI